MFKSNRPVKLQDCRQHGANAELFLVEGDSASQAVAHLRQAQFQAVLPMQGKPLNSMKATQQTVAEYALFKALIDAIGTGFGEHFDISKCRYGKIVLLMDPDADGIHCGALMLMFFYRGMRPLLESGMLELVRPPVGEVLDTNTDELQYAYTEAQFMALCEQNNTLENTAMVSKKYRGLAGISQTQLAHICIDPNTRKTSVMGVKDAQMAIEIFGQ
ncbi:MAG TPA: toprim domain-containing protein [Methylotenera sp.]|nr:toprim domain-containing protein [Methylotenera sp.]HPH04549.1 toprim domain-containing protein [Methylotenera sp.]HPN00777.1 toprim domain-containing protein [Methylotenera sp.]